MQTLFGLTGDRKDSCKTVRRDPEESGVKEWERGTKPFGEKKINKL